MLAMAIRSLGDLALLGLKAASQPVTHPGRGGRFQKSATIGAVPALLVRSRC